MNGQFWHEQNGWWKAVVLEPAMDWDEADRRLRCLLRTTPEAAGLNTQDREDVVQTLLLRLQTPGLLARLREVDTPAHYLASVMRNLLRDEWACSRRARRAIRRHAELTAPTEDQRPDRRAEWNEQCAKVRFVVNHVVSAEDRKVLWWCYRDKLTAKQIGARLGISEAAALQRLFRARKRAKAELDN